MPKQRGMLTLHISISKNLAKSPPKVRMTDFRRVHKTSAKRKRHEAAAACQFLPIFLAEFTRFFLFFGQYRKRRLEGWKNGRLEGVLQRLLCVQASDGVDSNLASPSLQLNRISRFLIVESVITEQLEKPTGVFSVRFGKEGDTV